MHPNQVFHTQSQNENLSFARERGFGVLAVAGNEAPLMAHIPFVVSDDGKVVDLHLVRSNAISRLLVDPMPARLAVSGPDSYISPDWYGVDDQVPTWNYVAVHLTGTLERRPQSELRDVLDRLSLTFEKRLEPKQPWHADKMTPEVLAKMMKMIVPFRLIVSDIDGTWKLSQNKPDEVRKKAARHVDAFGIGAQEHDLAALMLGAEPLNEDEK